MKTSKKITKTKRGITRKEEVANFLEGKTFLNSRVAFREFSTQTPGSPIKQIYFYTLFTTFGTRQKKSGNALGVIKLGGHKNCMEAYKQYVTESVLAETPTVSFAYFLNLYKRHFNVTGNLRSKAKVISANTKEKIKSVNLSTLSAREILARVTELLKDKVALVPTNLKNKAGIVKKATELFKLEGYKVE